VVACGLGFDARVMAGVSADLKRRLGSGRRRGDRARGGPTAAGSDRRRRRCPRPDGPRRPGRQLRLLIRGSSARATIDPTDGYPTCSQGRGRAAGRSDRGRQSILASGELPRRGSRSLRLQADGST
jgi:hypothetical protein